LEKEIKKDKGVVELIICIALVATGVLQYMRSPDAKKIIPYLSAIESSLNVFGVAKYPTKLHEIPYMYLPAGKRACPSQIFI